MGARRMSDADLGRGFAAWGWCLVAILAGGCATVSTPTTTPATGIVPTSETETAPEVDRPASLEVDATRPLAVRRLPPTTSATPSITECLAIDVAGSASPAAWSAVIDAGPEPGPFTFGERRSLGTRLREDQRNFYAVDSLLLLGTGLAVGSTMANTSIDERLHQRFQKNILGARSDDWFESLHASKELGNGYYILPLFATGWAAGELYPDSPAAQLAGTWGSRSLRGFVVGAPPLYGLQLLTGGSRPDEVGDGSSHWQPFADNNGISGHSFMGAMPFITAAKMTESTGLKATLYTASLIAPLSRVNDSAHYPSQVALGWWTAWLAASAVATTDDVGTPLRFAPFMFGDSTGVMGELRY